MKDLRAIVRSTAVFGALDPDNHQEDHDKYNCRWHADTNASLAVYSDHAYCYGCAKKLSFAELYNIISTECAKADIPSSAALAVAASPVEKRPSKYYATPPHRHGRLGIPSIVYSYQDETGMDCLLVYRFDIWNEKQQSMEKEIRQLSLFEAGWAWRGKSADRPLFKLGEVRLCQDIIVAEGEKAAEAINGAIRQCGLVGVVATTPAGGSKAPRKTNWGPLQGKNVFIWPDNDEPGFAFATEVAMLCNAAGVSSVRQFESEHVMVNTGDDAADVTPDLVARILSTRKEWRLRMERNETLAEEGPSSERKDCIEQCLGVLINDMGCMSFTFRCTRYVQFTRGEFTGRVMPISTSPDEDLVKIVFGVVVNLGMSASQRRISDIVHALKAAVPVMDDITVSGWRYSLIDGAIYVNAGGGYHIKSAPHSGATFIRVQDSPAYFPPLNFGRESYTLAVPDLTLREYMDKHFFSAPQKSRPLIAAWLCMSIFAGAVQQPILNFMGESGSGKTSLAMAIRNIIDPHSRKAHPSQMPGGTKEASFIMSKNDVYVFDNVSKIPGYLSDFLCLAATGGAFTQRKLFTDGGVYSMELNLSIIITSLETITDRADLLDRLISVPMTSPEHYVDRETTLAALEEDLPKMRMLLLHIATQFNASRESLSVPHGLKSFRMTEWAKGAAYVMQMAGYTVDDLVEALAASSENIVEDTIVDDVILDRLQYVLTKEGRTFPWEPQITDLYNEMKASLISDPVGMAAFPPSARVLSKALMMRKQVIRKMGYFMHKERKKENGLAIRRIKFSK